MADIALDPLQDLQFQIDSLKQTIKNPVKKEEDTSLISPMRLIQGAGSGLDSDKVDGIGASYKPQPFNLCPLGPDGKFSTDVIPTAGSGSGFLLGNGTPTNKNVLVADGTLWQSRTMSGDATISANTGTLTLANTAVTPASYGDSTHFTTFTVDSKGRLTAAASVALTSATPGGSNGNIQYNNSGAFGGTNNLFWDNSNSRVGIGTASPGTNLEIHSGGPGMSFTHASAGTATIRFSTNVVEGQIWAGDGTGGNNIIFSIVNTGGSARLNTVLTDGSLGIGSAYIPSYKLDVNGDINSTGVYRSNGTAGVSGTFTTADAKTVTVTAGIITAIV